jgi:hypothetical protein
MQRFCLITTGQPSTNPRLVKEADALVEAGFDVHVLCAHWVAWASEMDRTLLRGRTWSCEYVGGAEPSGELVYWATRYRHAISKRLVNLTRATRLLLKAALSRVTLDLERAAKRYPADFYIAHNLGALPAAVSAARKHRSLAGFDIEDAHSAMLPYGVARAPLDDVVDATERDYLCECDHLTAASSGIAELYRARHALRCNVTTILNVFSLRDRPREFRKTSTNGPLTLYWFSQTVSRGCGLEEVVRALGLLEGCGVTLHIRGKWLAGSREEFSSFCRDWVDAESICYLDAAPASEMVRCSAAYDLGLSPEMPSDLNNEICLPNKLFAYLLAGNAVVATNLPAQESLISRIGRAGESYVSGEYERLARILEHWRRDRHALDEARREAWKWGAERYNWELEKRTFLSSVCGVLGAGCQ